MRILTVCPSKYPKKLEKMIDSFTVTRSNHTNIIVNYEEKSITKIFNEVFEKNPDYDFYHLTNDDVIYSTPLWDLELANKGKISYGNDLLQGENLPTFPMIDGDIIRAVGWLQMPLLNKYCGDNVWKFIGEQLGILDYHGDVFIKHQWNGDLEVNKEDMAKFAEWLPHSHTDVEKIRRVLNANTIR